MGDDPIAYVTKCGWTEVIDHVLVIACPDPRFWQARGEFIRTQFNISHYDPYIVPGGPAAILMGSSNFFYADRPRIELLHKRHGFRKVIGISHYDCLSYKTIFRKMNSDALREKQLDDLRCFLREIGSLVPNTEVEAYYAEPAGEHIQFLKVKP